MQKKDRVIIDTNLWISFLLSRNFSKLDKIFSDGNIVLLFSQEFLDEFIKVASRPRFRKYFSITDMQELLNQISLRAEFIHVINETNLCGDPKDDFLLSPASSGKASHLITGDKDLLDLQEFGDTVIQKVTEYLSEKQK